MQAIGYRNPGPLGADGPLVSLDVPEPDLRPRDLLVRVRAVSVNPVDTKQRANAAPPSGAARILGFDAAGIVEAVGSEVRHYRVGDAVWYAGAIDRPGSNAELQAVDERLVGHKPASLDFADAAALPLTAITAWELLFDRLGQPHGRKAAGGTLLIVGGAGGVGSILIQLARRLTGLTVIATASRPETVAWVKSLGAHHAIDHSGPLDEALKAIGVDGVEMVASLTQTERHLDAILRALKPQGRLAVIDDPKSLDIVPFKRKSLSVHWELMFTRSLFGTPDMDEQRRLLDEVSALVDAGVIRTTATDRLGVLSPETLTEAHRRVESGRTIGKIVLDGL
ncbi:zinc-binding alcohol dehydrogenase family protein [Prosthecodimorpha staleyi]|uniref:Zinc-type alcohol dehydrogenase-like protein n=1 Tax=Prosthecodimorpha staleyi TaxID=2840188 RepID=A0A947D1X3_9HYPH|nr:zinc-binding alcohol dehydrogenase family protein [Prosthecodimorpha staleyi]MBT9289455.1 zinc-binding alcohol dehydrogenase family protein [Prosthecodimorpha staleyi]